MMTNYEKFLAYSTPSFSSDYKNRQITVKQFFEVFSDASEFGLKLLLTATTSAITQSEQLCVFIPTLS